MAVSRVHMEFALKEKALGSKSKHFSLHVLALPCLHYLHPSRYWITLDMPGVLIEQDMYVLFRWEGEASEVQLSRYGITHHANCWEHVILTL